VKKNLGLLVLCVVAIAVVTNAEVRKVQADKSGTSITYHLVHPLHKVDGVSKDVDCSAEIDPAAKVFSSVSVAVDVTTFDSGNSNRDSHAMEVIDAIDYPEASFRSTRIDQRGDSLFATGQLTFHGITHDITIAARPDWSGSQVAVNGGFEILLSDYKVERPSLLLMPVENALRFSLSALFRF
jgi:polyisoprenoid-binding protein YceI